MGTGLYQAICEGRWHPTRYRASSIIRIEDNIKHNVLDIILHGPANSTWSTATHHTYTPPVRNAIVAMLSVMRQLPSMHPAGYGRLRDAEYIIVQHIARSAGWRHVVDKRAALRNRVVATSIANGRLCRDHLEPQLKRIGSAWGKKRKRQVMYELADAGIAHRGGRKATKRWLETHSTDTVILPALGLTQ